MYSPRKVHVPERYHEKIKMAVTHDRPLSVKINLQATPEHDVMLTPGQIIKIERACAAGKKVMSIRMSRRQLQANLKFEGGFLSLLAGLATKILPTLLGGIASGVLGHTVQKAMGDGLYLSKHGRGCAKVDIHKDGITLRPAEQDKFHGLYYKNDNQIFSGKGILLGKDSPFKGIPLLGLIL